MSASCVKNWRWRARTARWPSASLTMRDMLVLEAPWLIIFTLMSSRPSTRNTCRPSNPFSRIYANGGDQFYSMKDFQCRSFLHANKISSINSRDSADYGWYLDGTKLQTGHLVVAKRFQ